LVTSWACSTHKCAQTPLLDTVEKVHICRSTGILCDGKMQSFSIHQILLITWVLVMTVLVIHFQVMLPMTSKVSCIIKLVKPLRRCQKGSSTRLQAIENICPLQMSFRSMICTSAEGQQRQLPRQGKRRQRQRQRQQQRQQQQQRQRQQLQSRRQRRW
jgi:hypothetical protein